MTVESITTGKVTGQAAFFAVPSGLCGSFAPGLGATGLLIAVPATVSGAGNDEDSRAEAGLSLGWATFGRGLGLRDERPARAPKAAVAVGKHGRYVSVIGAGGAKKQDEQQIDKMWAFRGPQPWRERT